MGQKPGKPHREGHNGIADEESPKHRGKRSSRSSGQGEPSTQAPPKVEISEYVEPPTAAPRSESAPQTKASSKARLSKGEKSPPAPKQPKKETNIDDILQDTSDIKHVSVEDKENVEASMVLQQQQHTPVKSRTIVEPVTPLQNTTNRPPGPQATSTPAPSAPNGEIHHSGAESGTDQSEDEDDDEDEDNDQQRASRSSSPTASLGSQTTSSSIHALQQGPGDRNAAPDFGRFYQTSYLKDADKGYMKRATTTPTGSGGSHFHRPANFTYSKEAPTWTKKKGAGMMALAGSGGGKVIKVKVESPKAVDLKNEEAIKLSTYPSARPPLPNEIVKIERADWPGPPSPASLLPELLRERKKSKGTALDDEEEEEEVKEDPQIQREIDELSKYKVKSSITTAILKELQERKTIPPPPIDPWKSSRVPSAKYEPKYSTRYQSPMFASPSRFLDRPRPRSWDDSDMFAYRSSSIPHYTSYPVPKPGYGAWALKSATLPLSGAYGGPVDYRLYEDYDQPHPAHEQQPPKKKAEHTSTSTVDTERETRGSRTSSSVFEGTGPSVSLLKIQRSTWHTETEPPVYDYNSLQITKFNLPKDVDRNQLEIYLNNDEFYNLFRMSREEFYKLAEWKRNDMKRRLDLY